MRNGEISLLIQHKPVHCMFYASVFEYNIVNTVYMAIMLYVVTFSGMKCPHTCTCTVYLELKPQNSPLLHVHVLLKPGKFIKFCAPGMAWNRTRIVIMIQVSIALVANHMQPTPTPRCHMTNLCVA